MKVIVLWNSEFSHLAFVLFKHIWENSETEGVIVYRPYAQVYENIHVVKKGALLPSSQNLQTWPEDDVSLAQQW